MKINENHSSDGILKFVKNVEYLNRTERKILDNHVRRIKSKSALTQELKIKYLQSFVSFLLRRKKMEIV